MGMKAQYSTLEDPREPLHPADGCSDGQPTRSATARDALTALARLLARQAAAEAMRAAIAPAASETGPCI
jgi:hypothetical protein